MHLDVETMSVATDFVTAVLGALFVFACTQNRKLGAPMMWGTAYLIAATGSALIAARGAVPDWLSINIANAMVLLGFAQIWAGARIFDGRPVRVDLVLASAVVWLVACTVPAFEANINLRIALFSGLLAVLLAATAEEFWHGGKTEPLMSRWPTVCVLLAYCTVYLWRIPETLLSPFLKEQSLMSGVSFALLTFGMLMFTVVLAFLLLNMTKERSELKYKTASLIDPLSGVANRRAFFDGAEQLRRRQPPGFKPLAVMVFDLDRFKEINDRFGHGVGDSVLKVFAVTANRVLGKAAVFGRIGGEEFAAVLAVDDGDEAFRVADQVRRDFAVEAAGHGCDDLPPSVSVGVVTDRDSRRPLDEMLAVADRALYRAKAAGRNCVEMADVRTVPLSPYADAIFGDPRRGRRAESEPAAV
jgi:diguanylate cyclase (GGDEF)-like protein